MGERLEVTVSEDLGCRIDEISEFIGFEGREDFVRAAVRRLVDYYTILICGSVNQ